MLPRARVAARLAAVSPTYRMSDPVTRRREAAIVELRAALAAARCAARLAALATRVIVVRELLLSALDQSARAERGLAQLLSTASRDVVA